MVPQLDVFDIKRCGAQTLGFLQHLGGRNKKELSLWVDELLNEPGRGNAIYFHSFSGNPFHGVECRPEILEVFVRMLTGWFTTSPATRYGPPGDLASYLDMVIAKCNTCNYHL